jgi:hypothetical protein
MSSEKCEGSGPGLLLAKDSYVHTVAGATLKRDQQPALGPCSIQNISISHYFRILFCKDLQEILPEE